VQAVDLGEHALRVAEDHAPLGGELDASARAPEHLDAELLLEPPDLLRDRRLRQVELLTRLGQRAMLGDGDDRAQMTELHAPIVPAERRSVQVMLLVPAMTRRNGSRVRRPSP
jgi:hypothetical protein